MLIRTGRWPGWLFVLLLGFGCGTEGGNLSDVVAADSSMDVAQELVSGMDVDDDEGPSMDLGADELFHGILDVEEEETAFDVPADESTPDTLEEIVNPFCQGNGDGLIDATEIPAQHSLGVVVGFTTNKSGTTVTVPDLAGSVNPDGGGYLWDFSAIDPASDETVYESLLPVSSFWFADRFEEGQFVQPFDKQHLGIYRLDDDGYRLVGLASYQEDWTALKYETPIRLMVFPMGLGDSWEDVEVEASGLFEGESYPQDYGMAGELSVHHTFSVQVDRKGTLAAPMGNFEVLRLYMDMTMAVSNSMMAVPVFSQRSKIVLFVAECVGMVVRVKSKADETAIEFDEAVEYKRLGF